MEFSWRSPAHSAMAAVHRAHDAASCSARRAARGSRFRRGRRACGPTRSGATVPMPWLPIPGCVPPALPADAGAAARPVRAARSAGRRPLRIARGGGGAAARRLPAGDHGRSVPAGRCCCSAPTVRRIGTRSSPRHPDWAPRVHAAGFLDGAALAAHLAACDVLMQPYPDGVTSRRTSVMACLSQGRAGGDDRRPPHRAALARPAAPWRSPTSAMPAGLAEAVVRLLADAGVARAARRPGAAALSTTPFPWSAS